VDELAKLAFSAALLSTAFDIAEREERDDNVDNVEMRGVNEDCEEVERGSGSSFSILDNILSFK
jgi:hypothetical protein